jgi:hypothetical protein
MRKAEHESMKHSNIVGDRQLESKFNLNVWQCVCKNEGHYFVLFLDIDPPYKHFRLAWLPMLQKAIPIFSFHERDAMEIACYLETSASLI